MELCMIGATELILISAVVLLLFGGKKLPELMKGMGKGIKSFKEGMNEPSEDGQGRNEEGARSVDEEIQRLMKLKESQRGEKSEPGEKVEE